MNAPVFASILVSGADARSFLQGQLTCDMDALPRGQPTLAGVNSAQGRVQAVVRVIEQDTSIWLYVVNDIASATLQRLRKYVLRSKVTLDLVENRSDLIPNSLMDDLCAGVPHVFTQTYESFVAQMINLDLLGGISFEKGCYTGQEIIARAHFRGTVKRRMFRYSAESPLPLPGTRVLSSGEHAGEVVYGASTTEGCELLAVVSLSQKDATLTLAESGATLKKLELPYSIADQSA